MVANLVEATPSATACDDIKNPLVASHQLTDFQKAEKLFQMPALGSRKPSDLMEALLETCPRAKKRATCSPAFSYSGCPGRSVFYWLTWITRTPRHWLRGKTSFGLSLTTLVPLPLPSLSCS
jgi:hypothetical protein